MDEFGPLEHFFAKRTLKEGFSQEKAHFLCRLMKSYREGHLCLEAFDAPILPDEVLQEGEDLFPKAPIVKQANRYYLQKNWVYETYILELVKKLRATRFESSPTLLDEKLLPSQKKAIEVAMQNQFSIICGGPGTGKTYTASCLVKAIARSKEKCQIALAAPTGKAASHLKAVIGDVDANVQAMTLHRLLAVTPDEIPLFSDRKIDADLVIVDEASMIDVPLLAKLLESIGKSTRLVLMGDPNQLPPVEAGSLFAEMAPLFGTPLTRSMRTENKELLALAEGINRGEITDRGHFLEWAFDEHLVQKLYDAASPHISWEEPDPTFCLKQMEKFRILGALRQGPFGTERLNLQIIREMGRKIQSGQWWAIPIMVTVNTSRQNLYNGSCGILIGKSRGGIEFQNANAYFPEKISYPLLPPHEVAVCLSIHKSQGSEFERVLALFPQGCENFGKEAGYTAVTRAKFEVKIVADEPSFKAMLSKRLNKTSGFTARSTST